MTEYKCGNCREILILSPRAKFCPECGSTSLNLLIKELTEPAQRETLGVYTPRTETTTIPVGRTVTMSGYTIAESDENSAEAILKEEEDQPRRRRRQA